MVCEGVPLSFLILWNDAIKPLNTMSEPAEHKFEMFWTKIWELTTLESIHLTKTTGLWSGMMFASGFAPSCNPKEVYQATYDNKVSYNRTDSSLLHGILIDVYENDGKVVEHLW